MDPFIFLIIEYIEANDSPNKKALSSTGSLFIEAKGRFLQSPGPDLPTAASFANFEFGTRFADWEGDPPEMQPRLGLALEGKSTI
jgi:hypothetical protein